MCLNQVPHSGILETSGILPPKPHVVHCPALTDSLSSPPVNISLIWASPVKVSLASCLCILLLRPLGLENFLMASNVDSSLIQWGGIHLDDWRVGYVGWQSLWGGSGGLIWRVQLCEWHETWQAICNYLILTMCDPDILDINCVRSCLGPDQLWSGTTLPAFLPSLHFFFECVGTQSSWPASGQPLHIGSLAEPLVPLLIHSSMLFMACCKKLLRVFWSAVEHLHLWEVRE